MKLEKNACKRGESKVTDHLDAAWPTTGKVTDHLDAHDQLTNNQHGNLYYANSKKRRTFLFADKPKLKVLKNIIWESDF